MSPALLPRSCVVIVQKWWVTGFKLDRMYFQTVAVLHWALQIGRVPIDELIAHSISRHKNSHRH